MKRRPGSPAAFSLVEITLALGLMAICFLTVLGLLPIAAASNRAAVAEGAAAGIASAIVADLRATPRLATASAQFGIPLGAATTLYFDAEGRCNSNLQPASRYRVTVTFPPNSAGSKAASFAQITITWPAAATPSNASGTTVLFSAFNRP